MTRRVAVMHQLVSAGGIERFLEGLAGGWIALPEIETWDITLFSARRNSAGYPVQWPPHLSSPQFHLEYLPDKFDASITRLEVGKRWLGIKGTGRVKREAAEYLRRRTWRQVEMALRKNKFDVAYFVYVHTMPCPDVPIPLITTVHDLNFKRFETLDPLTRRRIEQELPVWLERCRYLVVLSEFTASELNRFYPGHEDKIKVVRPGVPVAARSPTAAEAEAYRRQMQLPDQFLLTTGWIVPHKNQAVVFEALARLREKGVEIPLLLTGPNSNQLESDTAPPDPSVQALARLADANGLRRGRDFRGLGYVNDFQLECLYRLSSAVVIPSLYEGGSLPGLEAMRLGRPVIFSKIPTHLEQVRLVGGSGWFFDPTSPDELAEVVEEVLGDPVAAAAKANAAAELVPKIWSWSGAAAQYLDVFERSTRP